MKANLLRFNEVLCHDELYLHGIYVGGEEFNSVNFPSHLESQPQKAECSSPHKSNISELNGRNHFVSVLFLLKGAVTVNLLYFVEPIENKTCCELCWLQNNGFEQNCRICLKLH